MKKIIVLVSFVVILLAMVITCPTPQDHRETIKSAVLSSQYMKEQNALMVLLEVPMLDQLLNREVKTNDYFFFSISKTKVENKPRIVSFGVFKHVFLLFDFDKFSPKKDNVKATNN
jgi:hypothetical protein